MLQSLELKIHLENLWKTPRLGVELQLTLILPIIKKSMQALRFCINVLVFVAFQDLFSHSQSSQEDVHFYGLRSAEDCNNGIQNASVNLHFDTETQEDYGK